MTKQELASKMAEFLGWKESTFDPLFMVQPLGTIGNLVLKRKLEGYFFSPEGFFAVWDKLDEMFDSPGVNFWGDNKNGIFCELNMHSPDYKSNDRYTAFYTSVHEMRKKK